MAALFRVYAEPCAEPCAELVSVLFQYCFSTFLYVSVLKKFTPVIDLP
jgi:hypothetical protein